MLFFVGITTKLSAVSSSKERLLSSFQVFRLPCVDGTKMFYCRKGLNRGSVYIEFGITAVFLIITLLFIMFISLFFLTLNNSYFVARNFYSIIKNANLPLGTNNYRRTFCFTETNNSSSCLNCSQSSQMESLEKNLCLARETAKRSISLVFPASVTISSSRITSVQSSSVHIITVNVLFGVNSGFVQTLSSWFNSVPLLIELPITGIVLGESA